MNLSVLSTLFEGVPDDPFYQPRRPLWLPPEMVTPPELAEGEGDGPIAQRFALLINPFYPAHPNEVVERSSHEHTQKDLCNH